MKSLLPLFSVAAILTGCINDHPSEKLTSASVYKIAEMDSYDGMEIIDFVRENGWADADVNNKYTVQYNYKLRLTKPLPELILALAQEMQKDGEKDLMFPWKLALNYTALQVQWGGEIKFQKRLQKFIANCPACRTYLQSPPPPPIAMTLIDLLPPPHYLTPFCTSRTYGST